jgi:hypothetical protein
MEGEKGVENKCSSKDAGKQAELAFKLYDKDKVMTIFHFN